MAEPPPSRGPGVKLPPIPRAPIAPASAATDVVPLRREPEDISDDTRNLEAPDAGRLVERMLELVASEGEALLAGDDSDGRLADLNIRTALASWDALHQPDEALRFLELAESHPLAARMRLAAALTAGDPAALEALEAQLGTEHGALAIELAEAWLWRHGRADRAAALADRCLDLGELAPWRAQVLELALLAHAALGSWARVLELRRDALGDDTAPAEVATTAALLLDRADDPQAALAACWRKLEFYPGPAHRSAHDDTLGWLRTFDVALIAATILDDERRFDLLDKRAELLSSLRGGEVEALATRHALAAELERDREHGQAQALWEALSDAPAAQLAGSARSIASLRQAWAAAAAGDRAAALAAHRRLASEPGTTCLEVAATHAWRALELASLIGDASLDELARVVADACDGGAGQRWLELRAITAGATPGSTLDAETISRLAARGGYFVRWAALVAERRAHLDAVPRALELWRRAAELPDALPTTRDHLVRLHHRGDLDELAEAYASCARAEPDPRCAAALWCTRGIVDLARGDFVEAEESLRRAAALGPADPFCRAALAAVYRAGRRHDALAQVLAELALALTSRDARAAVTREYAQLVEEQLGDPGSGRAAIEQMIAERPDDAETMLLLARLYDREQLWDRAIELRRAAIDLVQVPARQAELWLELARNEEQRGDPEAALAAIARAAEADHPDASREQIRIYRVIGQREQALDLARSELARAPSRARRVQLQIEIAQLLTELEREPDAVIAAYLDVLAIEPGHADALAGIEEPARRLERWDELARAFRGAPPTPHHLEVLAEALAQTAAWAELAEVRQRQLEAASAPADKARHATELAMLHERELGDLDAAIRNLTVAQSVDPDEGRQQELVRVLRAAERWAELAQLLERELAQGRATPPERQLAILLELGELRAARLGRPAEAIQAYEAALARRPGEPTASAALEKLYEHGGRDRELARVLEARADGTEDPLQRAQLFARVATLRGNRGDVDGALAAYTASFAADPTNRDVFTAMERVCYKAERWAAAMQLYESAIAHVESGASRAYRLGDLYARRGNVQLTFLGQVEAAIASYQKVVEVEPQPAAAIKILEELCAQRGDWQPLIEAYERRGETQRDSTRRSEALRLAARLATERAGDARQSVRLQRKLLTVDPMDPEAVASVERYYQDHHDHAGLLEVLKLRLSHARTKEDSIELLKKIARMSEEGARDVDTATEHYLKILELVPDSREALDALGRIYESTEQWSEFLEVTRKLIRVTTDRNTKALLYFRCGSVMEAKFGREQDAIRYYDAAIKTSASCLPAVHGLRDLYRRREEWPRVIETLELEVKLWQDDKERAGVFAQIGRILEVQLGDVERAMHYYESALTVDPDCLPANQALFQHFYAQAEWERAQSVANALVQKAMREGDPSTRSDFYRKRGVVAYMTGDPRAAAESLIVALEIKPTNAEALDELGHLARERPDAWDYETTYRELEKLYRRREDAEPLLARVHVGRAALLAREGDLDQAAALYREAVELAPEDLTVLIALVDFHDEMRHFAEAIDAIGRFVARPTTAAEDRLAARMRLARIHADGEMNAPRAIAVLREVIQTEPGHQDAYYELAQQCFLLGDHAEARAAIDRVIELATAPGQPLSAEALARYYYYKGRILDAAGDARAAAPQYRRAIDYDPGYAPPALVLARRAADSGDQRQAETLLIDAAHAAMAHSGPRGAVPLQRGLARILLASGDRPAAIEAYRGILNVDPDSASDRVALAEIYAVDDPRRAIGELRKVIERNIHHAPAYRLLSSFYNRMGDVERANRVVTALDMLGFAEEADRATAQRLRATRVAQPLRHALDDDHRERLLLTPAAREPLGEVFEVFAEQLSSLVSPPSLGENLLPAVGTEPRLVQLATELDFIYGTEAEVFVGERVPGLAVVTAFPRRLLVLDRTLVAESEATLRFLFGYAFEAIRGGYAVLLQLGARQRRELAAWLRALLALDAEPAGPIAELVNTASAEAQKVLEQHAGIRDVDAGAWIDGMLACAKRAGLLACDDFAAAIWTVARLTGERLESHDETVALGAVLGGTDLVRFYLSDEYQELRRVLAG